MLLNAKIEILEESSQGPIITVAFAGKYPGGSDGNLHAAEMRQVAAEAVATHNPAGVVFDLTHLQYVWGDAIGGIVWALRKERKQFIPSCIVARGRTAKALNGFFSKSIFALAEAKLLDNKTAALEHIRERLSSATA